MEGERMKGEKAVIFCQECIHLRMWHASVGKCMDRLAFKCMCVYVCVIEEEGEEKGDRRGRGCGKTKK